MYLYCLIKLNFKFIIIECKQFANNIKVNNEIINEINYAYTIN
jgi:hypothetical protein